MTSGEAQNLILYKELTKSHYEKSISKYFYILSFHFPFPKIAWYKKSLAIWLWNFCFFPACDQE